MAESATSVGSLTFFGLFAMFSLSPLVASPGEARTNANLDRPICLSGAGAARGPPACPLHPQTSYWLGDANEMVAINTILIIVNGAPLPRLNPGLAGTLSSKKAANLR